MRHIKVLSVFGTRPDTIKLAPVVNELSKHPELIDPVTCGTAQHREMMDQVLGVFGISRYNLESCDDQTLSTSPSGAFAGFGGVERAPRHYFGSWRPYRFVGALASFYCKVRSGMSRQDCGPIKCDPFWKRCRGNRMPFGPAFSATSATCCGRIYDRTRRHRNTVVDAVRLFHCQDLPIGLASIVSREGAWFW